MTSKAQPLSALPSFPARVIALAALAASALACGTATAADLGPAFVANNHRTGGQYPFGVAAAGNGDSLLLWQDGARGGNFFIQRYDGNGVALQSDELYVGASVQGAAMDRFGNFALASIEPDGNGSSLYVTVYRRDGSVQVPKFKVNTTTETTIFSVHIASNANGQLAVAWGVTRGGANAAPMARTFSAAGVATSAQLQAADTGTAVIPQGLGIDGNGNFAISWAAGSANTDTYYRRFAADGTAQGSATRVHSYTASTQANSSVAMNAAGTTVVTWESVGQDGSGSGVYGQRFSSTGVPQGSEFHISESTAGEQTGQQVAMSDDGSFVVTWHSDNHVAVPGSTTSIYMRPYAADGTPLSGEVAVHAPTGPEAPLFPFVAVDPAGIATISWRDWLSSTDSDVYARRYRLDNQPTVTALSNNVPAIGLAGAAGAWSYFKIVVPAGRPSLTVSLSGPGTGNADLYGRLGATPTLANRDVLTTVNGNAEGIAITNVPPGTWYFGVYGASAFSGVNLTASY